MNLYKRRCRCSRPSKCNCVYWFRFRLHGEECRQSTKTKNKTQAQRIASVRQAAILEGREGIRRDRGMKLSAHIRDYTAHTAKKNRSSYKDSGVLARLLESVGDRRLGDISAFQIEKWKSARAKVVQPSTVNRELNIIRGCFSRAVDWKRLATSPTRTVKAYRVDNVRLRIMDDTETALMLDDIATAEAFQAAEKAGKAVKLSPAFIPDLRLMARATLVTLMRLSEVLALRRKMSERWRSLSSTARAG